jgi:ParB-like chromosome segregation protein Spo0J
MMAAVIAENSVAFVILSYPPRRRQRVGRFTGPLFLLRWVGLRGGDAVRDWDNAETRPLPLTALGEHYRRYRLADPTAEEAMARSLQRFGQAAPVTACRCDGQAELLDGFKRCAAAASIGWSSLSVRLVDVDERMAKAAIYGLNSVCGRTNELEEAWLVQALVREDGLTQLEAAELLNKHKSWVCRRLALLERLSPEAQAEMRLGLVSVTLARQLTRLPAGNQACVLLAARRDALTAVEVQDLVDLLHGASPEQEHLLLSDPRAALLHAQGVPTPARDPRLTPAGNRLARQLGMLLDLMSRLENWQRHPGLAELKRDDRRLLAPQFRRLVGDARRLADLTDDLWPPDCLDETP